MTVDPNTRVVRSLDGEYFMLREVADMVGMGRSTLRKWLADGIAEAQPSGQLEMGKSKIYLYTSDDVLRLRKKLNEQRTVREFDGRHVLGRPRKFTAEERQERSRLFSRATYYRRRAKDLSDQGRHEDAVRALRKEAIIREMLNGE